MHPSRHVNLQSAQKRAKRFKPFVKGNPVVNESEWNTLGLGLSQGDPLVDKLADWINADTSGRAWRLIQQALTSGIDSLNETEEDTAPLTVFFTAIECDPPWLDRNKLDIAQRQISRAHPAGYYVLRNAGLMAGYLSSDLNKPLIMTGALSGGASRRMAQTMKWYSDCASVGGMDRYGAGFKSSVHVRILHATIRRRILNDEQWDQAEMGLPINQTDMAATWLAFSVIYLLGIRVMGIPVKPHEAEAVMHLFHYACWLMGLDEHWFTDDEHEGRLLLLKIMSTYRQADDSSYQLGKALMGEIPEIPYPSMRPITWRVEQLKHLSTTRLFVGRKGMKKLGLPGWVPPVYPLACIPANILKHRLLSSFPGKRAAYEADGQSEREKLIELHFAGSAPHLAKVDKNHTKQN